mgnify:CR=1 FL=1
MRRRTFLRAAAAIPVALLSGCAVYDDGYYVGDVGYAPVPNPPPRPHSEPVRNPVLVSMDRDLIRNSAVRE